MEQAISSSDERRSDARDALSAEVVALITRLMAERGVPASSQAALLTRLCGLSPSQARRKLHGAGWSFAEVLAVARHFDASLDDLFQNTGAAATDALPDVHRNTPQPLLQAVFRAPGMSIPCRVRLGAMVIGTPGTNALLVEQTGDGWIVEPARELKAGSGGRQVFYAEEAILLPPTPPRYQIAILDDDPGLSEALGEWFNAAGYVAQAFTSSEQLLASNLVSHDAFVVDFVLAGGDSSRDTIAAIRQRLPDAPIILLTGKLRDGVVSEAELTPLLRTANVTFFEKPVRPSVLAATLQSALDRIAHSGAR